MIGKVVFFFNRVEYYFFPFYINLGADAGIFFSARNDIMAHLKFNRLYLRIYFFNDEDV